MDLALLSADIPLKRIRNLCGWRNATHDYYKTIEFEQRNGIRNVLASFRTHRSKSRKSQCMHSNKFSPISSDVLTGIELALTLVKSNPDYAGELRLLDCFTGQANSRSVGSINWLEHYPVLPFRGSHPGLDHRSIHQTTLRFQAVFRCFAKKNYDRILLI